MFYQFNANLAVALSYYTLVHRSAVKTIVNNEISNCSHLIAQNSVEDAQFEVNNQHYLCLSILSRDPFYPLLLSSNIPLCTKSGFIQLDEFLIVC